MLWLWDPHLIKLWLIFEGVASKIVGKDFLSDFKYKFCKQYFDDILALLFSLEYTKKFKEHLLSKHPNVIIFLDDNIFCENRKFVTNAY